MTTFEIEFNLHDSREYIGELLPWLLAPLGYDGFIETGAGLSAYIPSALFNADRLNEIVKQQHLPADCYTIRKIPEKNWNEEWERNFEPVVIDGRCLIRAPFHPPDEGYPLTIIIEPKMSFGTGHHETTSLMMREMLDMPFTGTRVLDAGCGTGILAILAEKLGAGSITAVDNDEWCYNNAAENILRNNCEKIHLVQGDVISVHISGLHYILANINLNTLLQAAPHYSSMLRPGGILLTSGILNTDVEQLADILQQTGLNPVNFRSSGNWSLVSFRKN